jgi:N6-L-threonylcarbamoyladenine synthase
MIASAASVMYRHEKFSELDISVKPHYDLEEESVG